MNGRFVRALLAFLALPGTVAFFVPLLLFAPNGAASLVDRIGLIPLTIGIVLLLWCVREFYVVGRGTLAPWSPPEAIVTTGPYQFSRNPMYVAVLLILWGWAIGFRSWALAIYAVVIMIAFHLRVRLYEEPWLERTFGASWPHYKVRVPRWIGSRGR